MTSAKKRNYCQYPNHPPLRHLQAYSEENHCFHMHQNHPQNCTVSGVQIRSGYQADKRLISLLVHAHR